MLPAVRDSWLVYGLYDYYSQHESSSSHSLEILLNVNEPHERFLCDKICEGLKSGGKGRLTALNVLGFVIRKQPPWLYRLTHNALMKELLKVLKTEEDLVTMMSALLALLTLMPIVPTYVAPYLHDFFEVFRLLTDHTTYLHICILPINLVYSTCGSTS